MGRRRHRRGQGQDCQRRGLASGARVDKEAKAVGTSMVGERRGPEGGKGEGLPWTGWDKGVGKCTPHLNQIMDGMQVESEVWVGKGGLDGGAGHEVMMTVMSPFRHEKVASKAIKWMLSMRWFP